MDPPPSFQLTNTPTSPHLRWRSGAGAVLVRHGRSGVLPEPRPGPEDETLGQVSRVCRTRTAVPPRLRHHRRPLCLRFSGGVFMETAERISLPDDCTVGYIVNALLGASLIRSPFFHSHLENLGVVSDVHRQVQPGALSSCCRPVSPDRTGRLLSFR